MNTIRLSVDLDPKLHKQLKLLAAKERYTMRSLVTQWITDKVKCKREECKSKEDVKKKSR